jgi:hypothetical protein
MMMRGHEIMTGKEKGVYGRQEILMGKEKRGNNGGLG